MSTTILAFLFSYLMVINLSFSFKIDIKNIKNNEYEIITIEPPKTLEHTAISAQNRLFSRRHLFQQQKETFQGQTSSQSEKTSSEKPNDQTQTRSETQSPDTEQQTSPSPRVYSYAFAALGYNFSMELVQNVGLFSANYQEYTLSKNGYLMEKEDSPTKELIKDPCYYQGYIIGEDISNVAVSLCEGGLQGIIQAYGTDFVILPKSSLVEDDNEEVVLKRKSSSSVGNSNEEVEKVADPKQGKKHVIFPFRALSEPERQCGNLLQDAENRKNLHSYATSLPQPVRPMTDSKLKQHVQHLQSQSGGGGNNINNNNVNNINNNNNQQSSGRTIATAQYIELLAVNDFARYSLLGSGTESGTAEIANIADSYYQNSALTPPVRLVLTAQVTFENGDPYGHTQTSTGVDVVDLLTSRFLPWASNIYKSYPSLPEHDSHVLISGLQFQTPIVGLAPVGGMCINSDSGAITSALGFSNPTAASTMAHEIGHTLGMQHDDYVNPPCAYGFIMSSAGNPSDPAKTFSTCSQTAYASWLSASGQHCLDNIPTTSWSPSICGNGVIEGSEQCDCGKSKYNPNYCCNCNTCRLNNLSSIAVQCSDQQICCSGCRFISSSTRKLCHAAQNSACDSAEYCNGVSGSCPKDAYAAPGGSCTDVFGDEGSCFRGGCFAWSTRCKALNVNNRACSSQTYDSNLICQKQFCTNSSAGSGSCFPVPLNPANQSDSYAQNGIPCGSGQQCFAGQCLESYLLWSGLDPSNPSFFQRLEGLTIDEILFYGAIAMGVFFVLSCAYRCICHARKGYDPPSTRNRRGRTPLAAQQHGNNVIYASDATSDGTQEGGIDPLPYVAPVAYVASEPKLPPGWHAYRTSNGRPYWYNSQRAETSWVAPLF